MDAQTTLQQLIALGNPDAIPGMQRYGISSAGLLGVSMPAIRLLARQVRAAYPRKDPALHPLAAELWASGYHEARILASLVDLPALVHPAQMDAWAADFDSWDVVDQTCGNLFDKTPYTVEKAFAWSARPETFIKRAGFVLMAELAHTDERLPDADLAAFLPIIEREAADERNFVRKAVNWALRQIGKRNLSLNASAIAAAERIQNQPSRTAHWIAADALRELRSDAVQARLSDKSS
jgi:3-methyladenine DNA glycosylase AlkD